jgi:excisionase family DNA binding protein
VKLFLTDREGEKMDYSVDRWYSLTEIKQYLGISRDTVLTWIAEKNMPAHKIGRLWKFKISEIDDWVKNNGEAING